MKYNFRYATYDREYFQVTKSGPKSLLQHKRKRNRVSITGAGILLRKINIATTAMTFNVFEMHSTLHGQMHSAWHVLTTVVVFVTNKTSS